MKRRNFLALALAASSAALAGADQQQKSQQGRAAGQIGDGITGPQGMVWVPAGEFLMGTDSRRAHANERPAHKVALDGFWMDQYHVTNRAFAAFVQATGYITTAERKPEWETLAAQLPQGTPRPPDSVMVAGAMVFTATDKPVDLRDYTQWWRYVPGADWRHPNGPGSNIEGKDEHPVVQVSHEDVLAYARWAGKRLPTEAEWEHAARGGLDQATYAWGDIFAPEGKQMAHTWNNERPFPVQSAKILPGTEQVGLYPANGYQLYDMAGNSWQWVADWYRPDAFVQRAAQGSRALVNPAGPQQPHDPSLARPDAPQRVIRGGSFLCSEAYCEGYRISARQGQDPWSSASNVGFRMAMSESDWLARRG